MTTLYIIRHGETDDNKSGRYQGQTDTHLNEVGREQSRCVAARMASLQLDAIYTSDLARASESAEIIAAGLNQDVIQDARLREIHVGRLAGLSVPEIAEHLPDFYARWEQDHDIALPDGESPYQVQERVLEAIAAIRAQHPEGHVAVVTHGGVIKLIVAAVLGLPIKERRRIVLENCSLTIVQWSAERCRLRSLNDTGHMPQAPSEVLADF